MAVNFTRFIIGAARLLGSAPWWLFPPTCLLCGAPGEARRDLCAGCYDDLPHNHTPCARCGEPLGGEPLGGEPLGGEPLGGEPLATALGSNALCGQCQRAPPVYDYTYAPFVYRPPLDHLIQELKFQHRLPVAPLLAELMRSRLPGRDLPQAIVPVPLHPRRLRARGFNQALEITRPLANWLQIPIRDDVIKRTRFTPPQTELDMAARLTNLRGAFTVSKPLKFKHIAILDDVVTTGSTAAELAQVLRAAGAERIQVWACARTQRSG